MSHHALFKLLFEKQMLCTGKKPISTSALALRGCDHRVHGPGGTQKPNWSSSVSGSVYKDVSRGKLHLNFKEYRKNIVRHHEVWGGGSWARQRGWARLALCSLPGYLTSTLFFPCVFCSEGYGEIQLLSTVVMFTWVSNLAKLKKTSQPPYVQG